jgi:hypothetical protein
MSTTIHPVLSQTKVAKQETVLEVIVYGHSALLYWWPLWLFGYFMAIITWIDHDKAMLGDRPEWFYPNEKLGVIYTLLLLMLIVITSTKIKGMKAALLLVATAFLALLFIHLGWLDGILGWIGHQSISLSFGYYLFSSSVLLVIWLISVFVIDHLGFWRFRPGQVTHEYLGRIIDKSYDTDNMTIVLNRQDDFFRHWVIGLGSGDLHMRTMGGQGIAMDVLNVIFVGNKMTKIQQLVATKPDVPGQA